MIQSTKSMVLAGYALPDRARLLAFMGFAMMTLITLFRIIPDAFAHGVTVGDKGYSSIKRF